MQDEAIRRAKRIFNDALGLDPSERDRYVRACCGGDSELESFVIRLLAADGEAARVFEPGLGGAERADLSGLAIGGFRIIREIGTGGMSTVYEAEQDQPRRRVALKVLKSSLVSRSVMKRFSAEAEILARLKHPHIGRVYEAGWHDLGLGGVPWFAMELVPDALPLTEYADRHDLGLRDRIGLVSLICDAVQHGHGQGIIHRDLKPANILVDGAGEPKIIDFGVARCTDLDLSVATFRTMPGELVGTLRYMSPEQCAGETDTVGIRSDVYALGVVLHELLSRTLPYDLTSVTTAYDIPRAIRESAPRPLRQLDRSIPRDVETIVLKCLQKSPEQRYATVDDLGRDLRRFLRGEPIEARRDHTWYVMRRMMMRHRAATAAAAALLLTLAGVIVTISVLYGRSETNRLIAAERAESLRAQNYIASIALARNALLNDDIPAMRRLLDGCPEDLRGWEWRHLGDRLDDSTRAIDLSALIPEAPTSDPRARGFGFAVSPIAGLAAVAGAEGAVQLVDLETGEIVRTLEGGPVAARRRLAFASNGSRLALRTQEILATYVVWDVASGALLLEGNARDRGGVCVTPGGQRFLTGDGRELIVVDVAGGAILHRLAGEHWGFIQEIGASADGRWIATGGDDGVMQLWDAESMEPIRAVRGLGAWITAIGFAPDGEHLMVATSRGLVAKYRVPSLEVEHMYERSSDFIVRFSWSPDGSWEAMATDHRIDLRDGASGDLLHRLHAGGELCPSVAFLGPHRLVTGCTDGRLRHFDLDRPRATGELGRHPSSVIDALATSPDGRWAATGGRECQVILWDLETRQAVNRWTAHAAGDRRIRGLAFSPDSRYLASCGADGTLCVTNVPEGQLLGSRKLGTARVMDVMWMPDSLALVAATDDGGVEVWSTETAQRIDWFNPGDPLDAESSWFDRVWPRTVAVAPDGALIATSGHERVIRLWSWPDRALIAELNGHENLVRDLSFSPDGRLLASSGLDGTARLWDVATGAPVGVIDRHDGHNIQSVRFSPDGTRLLTCAQVPRLWDLATFESLFVFDGPAAAGDAAFSGDGREVIVAGFDAAVRFWSAPRPGDR